MIDPIERFLKGHLIQFSCRWAVGLPAAVIIKARCSWCADRDPLALASPLEPAAKEVLLAQRLVIRQQHELLRAMRDRVRGLG